jgi:hypothetical protein
MFYLHYQYTEPLFKSDNILKESKCSKHRMALTQTNFDRTSVQNDYVEMLNKPVRCEFNGRRQRGRLCEM